MSGRSSQLKFGEDFHPAFNLKKKNKKQKTKIETKNLSMRAIFTILVNHGSCLLQGSNKCYCYPDNKIPRCFKGQSEGSSINLSFLHLGLTPRL